MRGRATVRMPELMVFRELTPVNVAITLNARERLIGWEKTRPVVALLLSISRWGFES
jgi:hypothetical protein